MNELEDVGRYKVVINAEEQYSIWPEDRDDPLGWSSVGVSGTRSECLDHIEKVWTDMRPASLRKWMAETPDVPAPAAETGPPPRDLVEFLSAEDHEVELVLRGHGDGRVVLDREFVQVRFPNTRGGTELTVRLEREGCDLSALRGPPSPDAKIRLAGVLELDGREAECRATIQLATLKGTGRLAARRTP